MRKKRRMPLSTENALAIASDHEPAAKRIRPERPAQESPFDMTRLDVSLMLALLIAALACRIYSLQFFHVIATDGTTYALTARAVSQGDWHGVAVSGFYPLLIAVATWFVSDLETAGRITSVAFGSLLVIPLYLLGKALFTRKVAMAACLVAIAWPSLIGSSCEVITQATYTTLQIAAFYFIWRGFMCQSVLQGCLAGLFMGLSYCTRPEAILLSIVLPAALTAFSLREWRGKVIFLWAYTGSFLLLFTLNILLVYHVTGEWQLSAKTDSALNDALSYYLNIPDINYIPGYEPKSYLDIIREHPAFLWKNTLHNLQQAWQTILPLPLWLLVAAGMTAGGFQREANRRRLFLLATFAPLAVIIVFYYIAGGYAEAYLPVLFLFAAAGLAAAEKRVKDCLKTFFRAGTGLLQRSPVLLFSAAVYAVVLFAPQIRSNITDADYKPEMDNGRRAEKHLGKLLKENLPPGKIMTRWARIAFYAERDWVNVPAEVGYEEIIKSARDNGVRYLVADAMLYSMRPALGTELFAPLMDPESPSGLYFFTDPAARVKGLRPVFFYNVPDGVGVVAYEIQPENS